MASQAVKIIDGGKLIIPAAFRRKLGIDTGDTVVIELGEDGLHVRSLSSAVRRAQDIVREFVPDDVSLADELIAERRVEAEHE
ncbi:AbrB/MazE/SpoVT family DNA-binding domain-containing protein [Methylobacterium sp. Leaf125]|uniref:AbrB/MazE/SpoVT family DNA-binding domain-containing protein n=1 Tax=Methylobacterium sp. Leaf125 TaxID=1736265 RepID=UPI0009E6F817|nr:AbrB/MazE/SpoVT family DNA-binding domain-containing protein [Methylobacterium sp. Leaf125]